MGFQVLKTVKIRYLAVSILSLLFGLYYLFVFFKYFLIADFARGFVLFIIANNFFRQGKPILNRDLNFVTTTDNCAKKRGKAIKSSLSKKIVKSAVIFLIVSLVFGTVSKIITYRPKYVYKNYIDSNILNKDVFPHRLPGNAQNIKFRVFQLYGAESDILYLKTDRETINQYVNKAGEKAIATAKANEEINWDGYNYYLTLPNMPHELSDNREGYTVYYFEKFELTLNEHISGVMINQLNNSICFFDY